MIRSLAEASTAPPGVTDVFLSYGLPGAVALILGFVAYGLWKRHLADDTRGISTMEESHALAAAAMKAALDSAVERAVRAEERADRLSVELGKFNEAMQAVTMPSLSAAMQAVQEAMRRDRRGGGLGSDAT